MIASRYQRSHQINMVKLSNSLVGTLNVITFLLSIPILVSGIWLAHKASTDCEKFIVKPFLLVGIFLLIVSLVGLIGAFCRISWLLWVYLLVMFVLIVALTGFTVFAFVITNKGAGRALLGKGYEEYRLGDYSNWLQKRMNNEKNWNKIKSCLVEGKACSPFTERYKNVTTVEAFYKTKNSNPVESGCCKPSDDCKFKFVNATVWDKPRGRVDYTNTDCDSWSNNQNILCYDCQSCKAGLLQTIKGTWKKGAVVNIIFIIFLIIVYSVGCCAFRNNRWRNYY